MSSSVQTASWDVLQFQLTCLGSLTSCTANSFLSALHSSSAWSSSACAHSRTGQQATHSEQACLQHSWLHSNLWSGHVLFHWAIEAFICKTQEAPLPRCSTSSSSSASCSFTGCGRLPDCSSASMSSSSWMAARTLGCRLRGMAAALLACAQCHSRSYSRAALNAPLIDWWHN